MKAKFGVSGWKIPLDKHKVMEIQYGFIQNICASKHKESKNYADHAVFCRIKFGVWNLGKHQTLSYRKQHDLHNKVWCLESRQI